MTTTDLLNKLVLKQDLTKEEINFLFEEIVHEQIDPIQIGGVLIAMRAKGESIDEIVHIVQAMRKHMRKVTVSNNHIIDTAGTGGDGSGTFNISTAAALIAAGTGVKVAKHGNGAMSSKCGSRDVIEALGVNIILSPEKAAKVLGKVGFVFLFAPLYHPAMKQVSEVRRALQVRTIFNILGPLANPAFAKRQLIGVADRTLAEKLAKIVTELNYDHVVIVTSVDGMDEISISAPTILYEIKHKKMKKSIITPEMFGIQRKPQKEILGGDPIINAKIIKNILNGEKGAKRDVVVLNSAAALYVSGKVASIKDGIVLAEESIDKGYAKNVLENLVKETRNI